MLSIFARHHFEKHLIFVLTILFSIPSLGVSKETTKSNNYHLAKSSSRIFNSTYHSANLDSTSFDSLKYVQFKRDSSVNKFSKLFKPSRHPFSVSKIINHHSKELTQSYHEFLKIDPAIRGKISVRILVANSGQVHDVQVINSSLNNTRFEHNILSQIKTWNDFSPISNNVICAYRQEFLFGE
jgi:TonB family protein